MRFQLLYGTIFISLIFNLGGIFFLLLQSMGSVKLRALRDKICYSESLYSYRKRKILIVTFMILMGIFFILRVGYFDILRLGITIFLLFAGLLVYFFLFVAYFNIQKLVSFFDWIEENLLPGLPGILGSLFLGIGFTLLTSALLVFLAYQLN